MKRCMALLLLFLLAMPFAHAQVQQNELLDSAFQMIEEDNIFLARYNQITGANVQARYTLGVPYFFSGQHVQWLYERRKVVSESDFFKFDQVYIGGFDCVGYTRWIYNSNKRMGHPPLDEMINNYGEYSENHLYSHRAGQEMPPFDQLAASLQVGDLLAGKKTYRHVMMFIGTLRDYGFTAEELPEMADYLDYALVIHCGLSPVYGERFKAYIAENNLNCATTDGGVCVSIIGIPVSDAPVQMTVQGNRYAGFYVGDYLLTIWDISTCTSFVWFRMVE